LKAKKITKNPIAQQNAAAEHGNTYGYSLQNWLTNTVGNRSYGCDNVPPMKGLILMLNKSSPNYSLEPDTHPVVEPAAYMAGISANALAILCLSPAESSASAVFTVGLFALNTPSRNLLRTSAGKVLENPKHEIATASPAEHANKIGFRP
jgi:hypothetical protein